MNLPKLNLSQIKLNNQTVDSTQTQIDFTDPQTRQMTILFEYKLTQLYSPLLGIYAVPQIENINIWHCIIFLRHGFYKDSKFKFVVEFTQQFPIQRPKIKFMNKVYHPLIDLFSGDVDVEVLVPNWNYTSSQMMYTVFKNLNNMFIDKSKLSLETSFNPQAGLLYKTFSTQFMQKVIASIQDSQLSFTKNSPQSVLIINYSHEPQKQKIKQELKAIIQEKEDFLERKEALMEYILNMT